MPKSVLLSTLNRNDKYPKMFDISAPYCCGTISLQCAETYTNQMLEELPNITFNIYTLQDDKYVLYKSRALSIVVPSNSNPISMALIDIPTSCILAITPEFDDYAFCSHNAEVDTSGGEKWLTPTTEFPIQITWDNTNIVADTGGGAPADTYTKEEIDEMLADKVSDEELLIHFIAGSNIEIVDNQDGTQTINASGEISAQDDVARAGVAALNTQMLTKPSIYANTTDYWNTQLSLVSEENAIYVYTDYDVTDEGNFIPAIKIGDGSTLVIELPFISGSRVTTEDINRWDNKVSAKMSSADAEDLIFYL